MRQVAASIFGVVAILGSVVLACGHTRSPADEGYDSCTDPSIHPTERLTLRTQPELTAREQIHENHVRSLDDATSLFAASTISNGGAVSPSPEDKSAHDPIDSFVRNTDFKRFEIVFFEDSFNDSSDGFVGQVARPGRTTLVKNASCGGSGGAAPPHVDWVAVYRIPLGDYVTTVGCGECGPPVPCCPP